MAYYKQKPYQKIGWILEKSQSATLKILHLRQVCTAVQQGSVLANALVQSTTNTSYLPQVLTNWLGEIVQIPTIGVMAIIMATMFGCVPLYNISHGHEHQRANEITDRYLHRQNGNLIYITCTCLLTTGQAVKENNSCPTDWNAEVLMKVQTGGQDRGCRSLDHAIRHQPDF